MITVLKKKVDSKLSPTIHSFVEALESEIKEQQKKIDLLEEVVKKTENLNQINPARLRFIYGIRRPPCLPN
jgi:flagellar biosynthesis chaperone FliJ